MSERSVMNMELFRLRRYLLEGKEKGIQQGEIRRAEERRLKLAGRTDISDAQGAG